MNINFDGKTALVTGASQGIGRAIAIRLSECGAKVFAIDKCEGHFNALKQQCPNTKTILHDISDWESTEKIVKDLGPIDLLVNNAGVTKLQPVGEITPDAVDSCFSVNVRALINISQVVAENMKTGKVSGSIVNISSQLSTAALEKFTTYAGTKGAIDSITRVMALELGPHNIRVNSVNPTLVLTEAAKRISSTLVDTERIKAHIPLGKFVEEEDVADAVVFLLSDKSKMINGVTLPIDGGYTAC